MIRHDARTLTRYNAWANGLIFDAVAALPAGEALKPRKSLFKNMVHMLNHNYVIDRIFQAHLEGRAQQDIDAWYVSWSDAVSDTALAETLRFTFVGGGEGAMTRGEVLMHIVNHTSYHRGFVAEMFYQVPARPPTTDLPVFLRDAPPRLD